MDKKLIHPMSETFHDYLEDESKMTGSAESISFPESEADIRNILKVMRNKKIPVTIQGGKTGLVGSAVPLGGHIMNLSHMTKVRSFSMTNDGEALLKVEPGITLLELRKAIRRLETPKSFFWPPDPSESTATVGGIASTNARGICYHLYGKTSAYVSGVRVMNVDGSIHDLNKGQDAIVINGESKDLLDVYLGGEGMYGVITELTLRLIPKPKEIWGIGFFFEDREGGMSFADQLKAISAEVQDARVAALEYLDHTILHAVDLHHDHVARLRHPSEIWPPMAALVFVEIHAGQEAALQELAEWLIMIASHFNGDPDQTWAFSGDSEIDKMRDFLHAAAETAIIQIEKARCEDIRITKLGLDISLEREGLSSLIHRFEKELGKEHLKACFWGHMGSRSLHIDILPENYEEFVTGKALVETLAERFPNLFRNSVTSYGIGKLKKAIFLKTVSPAYFDGIVQTKIQLDQDKMWNPGNMI